MTRILITHAEPQALVREVETLLGESIPWTGLQGAGDATADVWFCAGLPPAAPLSLPALRWIQSGWAGIVVYGCVRDTLELNECNIGIVALATHPQRSQKRGGGERDVAVRLPGAGVRPGEWVYADIDGVLIASAPLK